MSFSSTWLVDEIPKQWLKPLDKYWNSVDFFNMQDMLAYEYKTKEIFPEPTSIFNALKYCAPSKQYIDPLDTCMDVVQLPTAKVVILGQDPYPGEGRACGYAFGVSRGIYPPESLSNMFIELERDPAVPFTRPSHGYLESWAKQGVVALNSVLTVVKDNPNSHAGKGWEPFTDGIIQVINDQCDHVVFMLWGSAAGKKAYLIDKKKHLVLSTSHPSPHSVTKGFQGCGHFSKANDFLHKHGKIGIDWNSLNK